MSTFGFLLWTQLQQLVQSAALFLQQNGGWKVNLRRPLTYDPVSETCSFFMKMLDPVSVDRVSEYSSGLRATKGRIR